MSSLEHSGRDKDTPASVHDHSAHQIQAERARVLEQAWADHPHRFRSKPVPPALPEVVHINTPQPISEEKSTPELGKPAA